MDMQTLISLWLAQSTTNLAPVTRKGYEYEGLRLSNMFKYYDPATIRCVDIYNTISALKPSLFKRLKNCGMLGALGSRQERFFMKPAKKIDPPTPEQIRQARLKAGLTQTQAANIIHASMRAWQQWEAGDRAMHPAFFELFLIKTSGYS